MKFIPQDTEKLPRSKYYDLFTVRCAIPTFDVNQCILHGSTFCFCLLQLGLAVTGAPAEHVRTRIHGVKYLSLTSFAYVKKKKDE